ncbi:MAG: hypothetical protein ABL888_08415, partial [Pirellulaceae bacterium]
GVYLGVFAENLNPVALAVDGNGSVFVADDFSGCIHWFTESGFYLGTVAWGFDSLKDVVFDKKSGSLLAVGRTGGDIFRITLAGDVSTFASSDIPFISQIAVDSTGRVFATDPFRNQIKLFDSAGNDLGAFVSGKQCFGAVCDSMDQLHIRDNITCKVLTYDRNGNYVRTMNKIVGLGTFLSVDAFDNILAPGQFMTSSRMRLFSNGGNWLGDTYFYEAWSATEVVVID